MTWPSSEPSRRTSRRADRARAAGRRRRRLRADGRVRVARRARRPRTRDRRAARSRLTTRDRRGRDAPFPAAAARSPQPSAGSSTSYGLYRDGHGGARDRTTRGGPEQLDQLRFLHRVARLATTARTWDELLETVVDGTRDALRADVSSLYLLDRDGANLTLAATNGLDRYQIGRARVPFGEGVTGRVAATPRADRDPGRQHRRALPVGPRHRPAAVHRLDAVACRCPGTTGSSACSTSRPSSHRDFTTPTSPSSGRSPTCSPGSSRRAACRTRPRRGRGSSRPIDEARAELIALVTHELRTPLAVVRAYTDLLAEEPPLDGRESRDPSGAARAQAWHARTMEQVERLDRLVDSILASVRVGPTRPATVIPIDVEAVVDEVVAGARAAAPPASRSSVRPGIAPLRPGRPAAAAPDPRAPRRERRQVRAARDDDHARLADGRRRRPDRRRGRGAGHPRGVARADLRAVRPARDAHRARLRDRAVRGEAARRVGGRPAVVRAGEPAARGS